MDSIDVVWCSFFCLVVSNISTISIMVGILLDLVGRDRLLSGFNWNGVGYHQLFFVSGFCYN